MVASEADFETAATVRTGARLVASPPLKSPAPHDVAEASPKMPVAIGDAKV
jgi:hypothetical protein